MIKVYASTEKDFSTNGLGTVKTYKCEEEKNISLNGWRLTVECPIEYADLIRRDRIVTAATKEKGVQPFRVGNVEKKARRLYFTAAHVAYDMGSYLLGDVRPTGLAPVAYGNWLISHADQTTPYTVKGQASGTCPTRDFVRKTLREGFDQMLEDMPDVVIDPDGWDINIYDSNLVGADRGQKVIYGRNMQDWNVNEDWSEVCTKILPEGPDGLLLPEVYLISDTQYDVPYTKTVSFEVPSKDDAGNDLTDEQKQDILRQKAKKYLQDHAKPKVSYDIKSDIPQTLHINDTVKVLHPLFTLAAHVQGYTYDCNSGRVKNLTFGNYDPSPAGTVSSTINTINKRAAEAKSDQQKAIEAQTALIKNLSKTGYVYIDDNEIDILDKLPRESADKVWRWTAGGLGFSSAGVNGTFTTAITQDGRINADFITTGVLSADLVKTGILKDAKGLNYWNMKTGELNLNVASTIGGQGIASTDAVQAASDKADKAQETADAVKKTAIRSVSVEYAQGTSNTEPPADGWQADAPAWKAGQYIWQRTATTMSDGTTAYSKSLCITGVQGATGPQGPQGIKGDTGATGPKGATGATGKGIKSTSVTYQVGTSGSTAPTGTWSSTPVATTSQGQFLWTRTITTYTDNTSTTAYSVAAHGTTGAKGATGPQGPQGVKGDTGATGATGPKGADGVSPTVSVTKSGTKTTISITDKTGTHTQVVNDGTNGTPGAKGADGKTPYFHVKYSNDGGSTFTSNSGETVGTYIGTYTDYNSADSTSVSSYTWARIKGDTGATGEAGPQGPKGETGAKGSDFHWNLLKNAYKYTEATPYTYTSTKADAYKFTDIVSDHAFNPGDQIAIQAESDRIWASRHNPDRTNSKVGFWICPCNSANNLNNRSTVTQTFIPGDNTSTHFRRVITLPNNNEKYPDGVYIFIRFNGYGDGTTSNTYKFWNVKAELGSNFSDWCSTQQETYGATGPQGVGAKSIVPQYYLSTSSTAQTGGSWVESCPAWTSSHYIWVRSKITWTNGTTTYTTPQLDDAINSASQTAKTAQGAAESAQGTANAAASTADSAKSAASNAQTAADSANTAASAAQAAADSAQSTANSAQSAANSAQSTANAAASAASNAQKDVDVLYENIHIDGEGMHLAKVDSSGVIKSTYQTLVSDKGMRVVETATGTAALKTEGDTVEAANLVSRETLSVNADGYKLRWTKFHSSVDNEDGIGAYWSKT